MSTFKYKSGAQKVKKKNETISKQTKLSKSFKSEERSSSNLENLMTDENIERVDQQPSTSLQNQSELKQSSSRSSC